MVQWSKAQAVRNVDGVRINVNEVGDDVKGDLERVFVVIFLFNAIVAHRMKNEHKVVELCEVSPVRQFLSSEEDF